MESKFIPHSDSLVSSKVMKDLLLSGGPLKDFGNAITQEDDLIRAVKVKKAHYKDAIRSQVVRALKDQLKELSPKEQKSLDALEAGACTVTTGHQLMILGGTAFFEIKILSAVALASETSRITGTPVVPVFWMASEDHDFEEIASFSVNGQKFTWKHDQTGGPVGRLKTSSLVDQLSQFLNNANLTEAQRGFLSERLSHYEQQNTLAAATRAMVREWASEFGVLVIDGDDAKLKSLAAPLWKAEMAGELATQIERTTSLLKEKGYRAQVFPREINLFEITDTTRERITVEKTLPLEQISPNALLRPMYQEFLLPNISYVGGGGELAYWLQLSGAFAHVDLPMPLLYLRDSVVPISTKTMDLIGHLDIDVEQIVSCSREALLKERIESKVQFEHESIQLNSTLEQSIESWRSSLQELYPELQQHAEAMETQLRKTVNRSNKTRFRIQKKRENIWISRLDRVLEAVFPKGVFWERRASYADLIGIVGEDPKSALVEKMSTIKAGTYFIYGEK